MGNGSISGCCKKPTLNIAAIARHDLEIKKKETPNGYGRLYSGVRTSDNKYTCPVLAIHTWNQSAQNISTHHGHLNSVEQSSGKWLQGNKSSTRLTEAGRKDEHKLDHDEDIHIIPIEDVIKIKVSTEIKKIVEQKKTVRVKTPPPEELGCCGSVKRCCIRNVCCLCCKERQVAPEHIVKTAEKLEAVRTIVVTIEHVRHSLLDTPSNVRVLSKDKQLEFYNNNLQIDTLKFYYLHNDEFNKEGYTKQLEESEALARTVMQLKAMIDHYPDPTQLQQIVFQQHVHLFGFESKEQMPILEGSAELTTAVQIRSTTNDY